MSNELRNFLAIPYDQLEELNLQAKEQRLKRVAAHKIQEERLKYLTDEKRIKAVTVLFSDLEGRLHMLDYDKKFLVKSYDNLTFDGSSIRGFTAQRESDLRLGIDWSAFYWGPADVFGPGKILVFGEVIDKGGTPYSADIRGILKTFADGACTRKRATRSTRPTRSKASYSPARTPNGTITRPAQFRVREHGRLLSLAAGRSAAHVHRYDGRSAARDGLPEREGPSGSGTVAVRDQLLLRRSGCGSRPDPALQADLPPGGDEPGPYGVVPAQAGGGRERQRHAHQRFHQQGRQEPFLGPEGRGKAQQAGMAVRRPHS